LQHGGSSHFVIEQPDGTRTLLPAWMTEPLAAQIAVVKMPRLTLEALFTLGRTIDGALLSHRLRPDERSVMLDDQQVTDSSICLVPR
jgi:hypothetical protein